MSHDLEAPSSRTLPVPLEEAARTLCTPLLLLDVSRLERNLERMRTRLSAAGVRLRPHLKTAKCPEVARMALEGQAEKGITVSTVREAEFFAHHGFDDLFWAVTPTAPKLERVARLATQGVRVRISLDGMEVARSAGDVARRWGVRFPVMLELECGDERCGLAPEGALLARVGRFVAENPSLELVGVHTHAGHSYAHRDRADVERVSREECAAALAAAGALRASGLQVREVSVGSTPTALRGGLVEGVTEVRAGVYMFSDCFQAGIGSSGYDDIALSVLTTVLSHRPELGHMVVDAGALAMSKDSSTERLGPPGDVGYGRVCHPLTQEWIPGLRFRQLNQEHGIVRYDSEELLAAFPVGSLLRIQPNHACMTAAGYDRYHVTRGPDVVDVWARGNGW